MTLPSGKEMMKVNMAEEQTVHDVATSDEAREGRVIPANGHAYAKGVTRDYEVSTEIAQRGELPVR